MKVILSIYSDNERAGGSVRVAEVLSMGLLKLGIDVHIAIAYGGPGRLAGMLGDRCHFMHASGRFDFPAWLRYKHLINKLKPNIVHYIDSVGWMTIAGINFKSKRIVHQHFRPDVGPNGHKRFTAIRLISGTADKVIAISAAAGRQLIEKCKISESKIAVVYNAVNPEYLAKPKINSELSNKKNSNERVLGMAIRIVEDKGVEDALHLVKSLPQNYTLSIAGEGPRKIIFKNLAEELGISNRIKWIGSVSDISKFYSSIDYYLFMSWYEGFGLSVAEAMFSRKPVVGLLGDGEIAEIEYPLVTKDNSLLIDRSTISNFGSEKNSEIISALSESILKLDADETKKNAMIENAYNWVENRFTVDIQTKNVLAVYLNTLSER